MADAQELAADMQRLVTTDCPEALVHVLPLGQVTRRCLERVKRFAKCRPSAVVAFKPTGWTVDGGDKRGGSGECVRSCESWSSPTA